MRMLTLCFVASSIMWSGIIWCVVCFCTWVHSQHFTASKQHLGASLIAIGLASAAAVLWTVQLAED